MSYSEQYHASIEYSGSISYSYPASEHGGNGTAHYSGQIPVNVTIHVNTNPFDGSVSHFNGSIDGLTGSVVAMRAAQCAAIDQTTREVSESLVKGFFGTIKTEISQQLQALDSAIKAGFGLIQSQGQAVGSKKTAMEADYNRIASRYAGLFADLDSECHKRIHALDRQAFNLSEKVQRELLSDSASNAAARNLLGMEDDSSSKSMLLVSAINRKTIEALQSLRDYITQESTLASLVESFLYNETEDEPLPVYIPVVWAESDLLESGGTTGESFIPAGLDGRGREAAAEGVNAFCTDPSRSSWGAAGDAEKEALGREFKALAESRFSGAEDETERRICRTMLSLWDNTAIRSIE